MLDIKTVKLRSEKEIIASWNDKETVAVSVICATYNHELYIEDAITGFLMQETDFAFEVIIHDDASKDRTAKIVKEYQLKYPKIIKPIYQTENQYSKGNFKPGFYMTSFAKGEFLAWCEGDDYWCDKNKLNLQVDLLKEYPNVNLCIHDGHIIEFEELSNKHSFPKRGNKIQLIEYIQLYKTAGQFSPTASLMVRTIILKNIPSFIYAAPIGDFFIEALSGRQGVLYLPAKMSVYRKCVEGSWSSILLSHIDHKINFNLKMLDSLLELSSYLSDTESKYVVYKIQFVYFQLSLLYIQKHSFMKAIVYQLKSLKGSLYVKKHIKFIIELLKFFKKS
ncbi:glycosyltransferase [Psychromonas sp. PT13]|uniref:glycosyltransferase n=1 Tax=Psychromonas sp. PT13 TaxID=3439547 RepID=UPI003EB7BE42